jgi:protein-tyrosine-phosphatase
MTLCIQNRCRSQIAEAFAQKYAQEHVVIESAGLEASTIHPVTIEVIREVAIDISDHVRLVRDEIEKKVIQLLMHLDALNSERMPAIGNH